MAKDKEKAAEAEATEEKEPKIAPKPEGYVSPYAFAKVLSEEMGKDIRPQTVYAQVRNKPTLKDGTEFPVEENTDGHYMINVEAGLEWYRNRQKERDEAKAAKAKAADKEAAAEE